MVILPFILNGKITTKKMHKEFFKKSYKNYKIQKCKKKIKKSTKQEKKKKKS